MTPAQQALLQKAVRSLQAAKVLNETNLAEFAASRAYYTMFYAEQIFYAEQFIELAERLLGEI